MYETAERNRLASVSMHHGMDLAQENSTEALEEAVRRFEEAIALRRTLPLEENPDFRYGLSAGLINRGDALARLGAGRMGEAIDSYDEALALLKTLPLAGNSLFPRRLAIALINRGVVRQGQGTPASLADAAQSFREAINVLQQPFSSMIGDRRALLAGAWVNLAGALAAGDDPDTAGLRSAAAKTIELARGAGQDDLACAQMMLRACLILCRAAVRELLEKRTLSDDARAQAFKAIDEGLALAAHWLFRDEFAGTAREILCFACRLYEQGEPTFLARFLMGQLAPERFGGAAPLDQPTADAIRAAIFRALEKMQADGFQFVTTPGVTSHLDGIEQLRIVEERLKEVRA
jgi:hypothetical protein